METAAPFSKAEYQRRIELTRRAMQVAGLDMIFVEDPSNMAWLTGYDGWSFYVHQGVILGLDHAPVWWGRLQDANGARRTVWMDDEQVLGYNDLYIQNPDRHPMEDLARQMAALGHATSRIGVEMEGYYYSVRAHQALQAGLPDAQLLDATGVVNWERAIKSEEEITFIRRAAKITDKIMTLAIDLAEPGLRKNELVAEVVRAGIRGVGESWGDYPAIVPLTPSGPDAAAPHLTWNGDEMRSGEVTFFELSGCYRRYHAPLSRSVFLGRPPQQMRTAAGAVTAALAAGIDKARAGTVVGDVACAVNTELSKAGIDRDGRCGYPIGLSYPPDWGERTYSLRPDDTTVLEPGMTFHLMPGLWMDDWGLETTETLLIRPKGPAEPLCSIEQKLFIKD